MAVLALVCCIQALADVSGTAVLTANTALNLDTGKTSTSGGDILWTGTSLAPQGTARAYNIANSASLFGVYTEALVAPFKAISATAAIPTAQLPVNQFFAVFTNSGKTAKLLVTAKDGTSITLQFVTFGAAETSGPVVKQILNNSSQIPAGFPNYGIAPSSLFVIKGSGLADPGDPVLQSSADPGIPLSLNGASITVVVNGVTTHPALYYTSPAQLAAVLPAATPVGSGTLTVTYRGATSAPASIQVVPAALGINTYNYNTGVATDALTGALLSYANSAKPGQAIVLWTTGLGADSADSDTTYTLTPHAVNTPLQIIIGGVPATIQYQGASPYPGVNQINLTIPTSVPAGCWIPLAAITGTVVSNVVTLPIQPGGGACTDPVTGVTGGQVSANTLKAGFVGIIHTDAPGSGGTRTVSNTATAAFGQYTGLSYSSNSNSVSPGGCVLTQVTSTGTVPTFLGLDPGTITLTGPTGSPVTLATQLGIKGAYFAELPADAVPSSGGTFTFRGSGGADVGSFTSSVKLSSPLFNWTNQSAAASVDRTQNLSVTWTGGAAGTYVYISGTATSTSLGVTGGFTCLAAAEAGQFTVPSYILLGLPAGTGGTSVQNNVTSSLSASGLDLGSALADVSYTVTSQYK